MPTPRKGEKRQDFISRCISHVSRKGEGKSHDQRVAMCHSMADEHYSENEEKTMKESKSLTEGLNFSTYLILEATGAVDTDNARGYIRSLPQYQEMIKDQKSKSQALQLAKRMVDQFGNEPLNPKIKDHILDQFDELSSKHMRGSMMGDWKGEREYQRKKEEENDLRSAMDKWEQTTGMDAETGEDIPKRKRQSGARVGMDYAPERKAAAARADFSQMSDQADRLGAAKSKAAEVGAPQRGNKVKAAREIFKEDFGEKRPSEIIRRMMDEVGMSKAHATTYYYKFKKAAQ